MDDLLQELQAESTETTLQLRTIHGTNYVKSQTVRNFVVSDLSGNNPVEVTKAFTREEIPVNHQQIPRREHIKEIPHLKEIAGKLPDYMKDIKVGILIGNNCSKALQPLKVIPTHNDGPYAIKLHHGWTIIGPLQFKLTTTLSPVTGLCSKKLTM